MSIYVPIAVAEILSTEVVCEDKLDILQDKPILEDVNYYETPSTTVGRK